MQRYFPTLPPEIWELIITDHHLYGLKYIKTIKMIPSRHCIIETVYNQLIQSYIDNICKSFYSHNTRVSKNIISKPHIFNTKNLLDIIYYITHNMKIDGYPDIYENYGGITILMHWNKKYKKGTLFNEIEQERILRLHRVHISPYGIKYTHDECCAMHRIGGPALTKWYYDGNNQSGSKGTGWTGNSERTNQSSSFGTDRTGNKEREEYYIDGIRHRIDGPAVIKWYKTGSNQSQETTSNGKWHRDKGPAIIKWNEDGEKYDEQYYITDIHQYTTSLFFSTIEDDDEDCL